VARNLSLALVAVALLVSTASAQSKRYPPPPKDADRDAEQHSSVWESALDPERKPYEEALREARRLLDDRSDHTNPKTALAKLDEAVARLPKEPRAYVLRGEAHLQLEQWAKCADDLAAADALEAVSTPQQLELGICQGRAGRFADAERTLVHSASTAPRGETWMRLGEVRIAIGKLDEAVDALSAGLEAGDGQQALIHWLLALAYDRARRPTAADDQARQAIAYDAGLNAIEHAPYPYLQPGDKDYLYGLAYRTAANGGHPIPEYALMHFRSFLRAAPDSPWRRRAMEHVRELSALELPQTLDRVPSSTAIMDLATILPVVKKNMPAMRACLAKQPGVVVRLTFERAGPTTPEAARDRPRYKPHLSSTRATLDVRSDAPAVDGEETALRCVQTAAERMQVPLPKERDTWYGIWFYVVAP
jgi:tetratricopeptide (TPR) repeat protein